MEQPQPGSGAGPSASLRWRDWLIPLAILLLAAAGGAAGLKQFLKPILGRPGPARPVLAPAQLPARVTVADGPLPTRVRPGDEVVTTWVVINSGQRALAVDAHRFVPGSDLLPVLPLPRTVPPGARAQLLVRLTIPPFVDRWTARWVLTGPQGPVSGGVLEAIFLPAEP